MMKLWDAEEEAHRLHVRFDELKATLNIGQAEFARKFEVVGGPSMVSQHIKGRRPISLEAAVTYAKGFQCSIKEISPRLALEVEKANQVNNGSYAAAQISEERPLVVWPFPLVDEARYRSLRLDLQGYVQAEINNLIEKAEALAPNRIAA